MVKLTPTRVKLVRNIIVGLYYEPPFSERFSYLERKCSVVVAMVCVVAMDPMLLRLLITPASSFMSTSAIEIYI